MLLGVTTADSLSSIDNRYDGPLLTSLLDFVIPRNV